MIVSVRTVILEKHRGQELVDYVKENPIPGSKTRFLRPTTGWGNQLLLVGEWESLAAMEAAWAKWEAPADLAEVWARCVQKSTVQLFREV